MINYLVGFLCVFGAAVCGLTGNWAGMLYAIIAAVKCIQVDVANDQDH